MFQGILAGLLVALAAFWLGRKFYRSFTRPEESLCGCGCGDQCRAAEGASPGPECSSCSQGPQSIGLAPGRDPGGPGRPQSGSQPGPK